MPKITVVKPDFCVMKNVKCLFQELNPEKNVKKMKRRGPMTEPCGSSHKLNTSSLVETGFLCNKNP